MLAYLLGFKKNAKMRVGATLSHTSLTGCRMTVLDDIKVYPYAQGQIQVLWGLKLIQF